MLFYRVKPEADQKPMLIRKRGRNEIWSVYIKGELFTPNEVTHRNLKPEYLEGVEVNRRKTQKIFGVRMPTSEASITPVKLKKEVEDYFNVCESRFIPHAILNLCYAENRVNEILKELRHDDLDKTVSSDHES